MLISVDSLFGKPGKGFDLDDIDIKDLKARLHHLSEELKQLKKKVNPKVNHMLERYDLYQRSTNFPLSSALSSECYKTKEICK